jgi:ribonuclease VapC
MAERGSEAVEDRLSNAAMSAVNYSEVLKKTIERGGDPQLVELLLERAIVDIVPFDQRQAADAAALFPRTRENGLSFADRACLALAMELRGVLYTADRRLAEADAPVKVVLIRPKTVK